MSDDLMVCLGIASIEGYEDEAKKAEVYVKELEAKLVKFRILASTMAEAIEDQIDIGDASMDEEIAVEIYRTTLAELTGGEGDSPDA